MVTAKEVRIIALLVIDTIFFLLEVIIGYAVHSLALIADSFHMLNDIFSLIVALWAVRVSTQKSADAKYTYGWKRAEILGALINAVFLLALCFSILIEAIQRLISPSVITNPKLILYVGTAGLISNIVGLFLFHEHGHSHGGGSSGSDHGHSHGNSNDEENSVGAVLPENIVNNYDNERTTLLKKKNSTYLNEPFQQNDYHSTPNEHHSHDHSHGDSHGDEEHSHSKAPKKGKSLNMHGVFLHVLGDALGNVGVILTALFIWKTDYSWKYYTDPLISLVITAIIFSSALPLCRRASRILLQATPSTISADSVQDDVLKVEGVVSVHDFHIWNLTEDIFIASLHVEVDASPETFLVIASSIRAALHNYGIHSATVQPEFIGENNLSSEAYQQFTKIAGGKYSRNNSSDAINKVPNPSAYGANSSDQCIIDTAVNCNTNECLEPTK
ncbi:Cobalt uptake protein COT1 [Wickerhamomyces ciferrii]|uniref:Cobalt uptake protein COT1 n=1 Tax=Wickerhamomyces ciferrii (strain ATCC 14091 / BCRC 22168 / CBS 111 / JCM 3599 / NBRC 0793 / NRRL Y-1031 F-60-10) TaxID=1206466 RepID=K0KPS2_WICCF|nr:Cobalt uptake protein COT1 [Wickerhamomyces ciferrii]CCH43404.1 Cobalt uptake protein COT1 [Wickerhamomyces ciferrii]